MAKMQEPCHEMNGKLKVKGFVRAAVRAAFRTASCKNDDGRVPIILYKFDIALAYSNFGCAEDTLARQNANKFAFALAYSYLCSVCNL